MLGAALRCGPRTEERPLLDRAACPPRTSRPHPPPPPPVHPHFSSYAVVSGEGTPVEVRAYGPSAWASTSFPAGTPLEAARSEGFRRLFRYISTHGIAMTAPVLTRVGGDGGVTVSFMLPAAVAGSPPTPDAPVFVERLPAMKVVVKSWSGPSPDSNEGLAALAAALASDATASGVAVQAAAASPAAAGAWLAGYDSPMTPPDRRHGEVWLPLAGGGGGEGAEVRTQSASP